MSQKKSVTDVEINLPFTLHIKQHVFNRIFFAHKVDTPGEEQEKTDLNQHTKASNNRYQQPQQMFYSTTGKNMVSMDALNGSSSAQHD